MMVKRMKNVIVLFVVDSAFLQNYQTLLSISTQNWRCYGRLTRTDIYEIT